MDGKRLRKIRKEKGYTIEQLAELTKFTASYISQVERSKLEPSISALYKICDTLKVSIYNFIEDNLEKYTIIRKKDRKIIKSNSELNYNVLTPVDNNTDKQSFYVFEQIVETNQWTSNEFINKDSHICIIVKQGTLFIEFIDNNQILMTGDSITLIPNVSFRCYNPSEDKLEILYIFSNFVL